MYCMCWNAAVSLNTFAFSTFVLGLIMYNNAYTQYKIEELNNMYVYIFFISFISMQLVEFFIWRNIDDPLYNRIFTSIAILLLLIQPIASNLLITNKRIRNGILFIYMSCMIPFAIYKFMTKSVNTTISEMGHLKWNALINYNNTVNKLIIICWFLFFLFPLFYERKIYGLLFGLITLFIIIYNYSNDKTDSSMWCWIANSVMVYYAIYLLFYLPFLS